MALRNIVAPLTTMGVMFLAACDPGNAPPGGGGGGADGGGGGADGGGGAGDGGGGGGADGGGGAGGSAEPRCGAPSGEPTIHEGDLSESETWTAAGSPHIVSFPVRLLDGVTLTIEPCAEVRLEEDTGIAVTGEGAELRAEGTEARPIVFRGSDGARWNDVHVAWPGKATLRHVTLEGGGGDRFHENATLSAYGVSVTPAVPALLVDHVTVRGSLGAGVLLMRAAAFAEGSTDLTITESGSEEHPYPLELGEQALGSIPTGVYTGNRKDEILIQDEGANQASGLQQDTTLRDRGVPYHFGDWQDARFNIGGGGEDAPPTTLTIEPGVTLRFEPGTWMRIERFTGEFAASGALRAVGTPERPIVFTSAAEAPAPGDWGGLWFGGIPRDENVLENVIIEYAGYDCSCSLLTCNDIEEFEGAVIFSQEPSRAFIQRSTFRHIAGHGVTRGWVGTSEPDFVTGNTFEDVTGCAQTRPWIEGQPCYDPLPACPEG
ncbi:hypothetical protein SOCEGT47_051640 [Sorangium cellulosum]|uniref:Right handed beta helix domain-containing protein n=1 Tax=Sorangium cellulosum TaxID=56 RepID=A0A4P2Q5E4_SORCE|nr:hypothetical protein [Sorangium cellulosum]AUX24625.1 hypothetical protein SOCEGT47_051640 [Sorangium cellulosum]